MSVVGTLVIEMAANVARLQKNMQQVQGTVDRAMSNVKRSVDIAARSIAALGAGFSAGAVIKAADEYTKLTAQLKLATNSQEEFNTAFNNATAVARRAQADVSAVSNLYARITSSTRELGLSQTEISRITENVALSLKISGASAEESASATLQLSQAFASGVLRGEEFNAVSEAAPGLLRALAESLNVPVGALKEMASQGVLTSEVLAKAFKDEQLLTKLRQQAEEVKTVSSSFVGLKNELVLLAGQLDKTTGATGSISGAISSAAQAIAQATPKITEMVKELIPFAQGGAIALGLAAMPRLITAVAVAISTRLLPALIAMGPYVAAFAALSAGIGATIKILNAQGDSLKEYESAQKRVLSLENQIAAARKLMESGQGSSVTAERLKTLTRQLDEAKAAVAAFEKQMQTQNTASTPSPTTNPIPTGLPTQAQIKAAKQAAEQAQREWDAMMDARIDQEAEIDKQLEKIVTDRQKKLADAAAQVYESTRSPLEKANMELANLQMLLDEGAIDWETYARAVMMVDDNLNRVAESGKKDIDVLKQAIDGAAKSMAQAFTDFAIKGKGSFKDLVDSILNDIARLVIQKQVTDPLVAAIGGIDFTSLFGFANGGIMTSAGPLPMKAYSTGGIATGPQLALYGEGRMNEAYVPLPDGKTIPVTMTGGGGANVVVNVVNQPGQTATVRESNQGGVRQLDVIIEQVESGISQNIAKGRGLAPTLERQYGLNRSAGALR